MGMATYTTRKAICRKCGSVFNKHQVREAKIHAGECFGISDIENVMHPEECFLLTSNGNEVSLE